MERLDCPICNASPKCIGESTSLSTDRTAQAARDAGYTKQRVYLCFRCGFVYISPILDDRQTLEVIFRACDVDLKISASWHEPAVGPPRALDPFTRYVRIPSLNRTIEKWIRRGAVHAADIGAHGGDVSLNLDWPMGSMVDLIQVESSYLAEPPRYPTRDFRGLLQDLPAGDPTRWDVVLALHVLEHTDDPVGFLRLVRERLQLGGLVILEVPYEYPTALAVAVSDAFEPLHNQFFAPWSLRAALAAADLKVLDLELLDNFHTGVGSQPYPVIRAVASPGTEPVALDGDFGLRSLDKLAGNLAASIAFRDSAFRFKVFIYSPRCEGLAATYSAAPGFSGVVTSNADLPYPNVFTADLSGLSALVTVLAADRESLGRFLPMHDGCLLL